MDKKGVGILKLTVGLIVLVVTLGILIYSLTSLGIPENIDEQACLTSVQARSTFNLNELVEPGRDYLPLNCKTEKVCVSASGGDCDASGFKPSRANPVTEIEVDQSTKAAVLDTLSNSLYDCHKMLGQGQLNFLPGKTFPKNYCLICDHIVLDEEARKNIDKVTFIELYRYMATKTDNNGKSYLEFVYGVKNPNEMLITLSESLEAQGSTQDPTEYGLDFSYPEGYAIMTQQSTQGQLNEFIGVGSLGVGSTLALGGLLVLASPFTGGGSLVAAGVLLAGTGTASLAYGDAVESVIVGDKEYLLASGPMLFSKTPDGAGYVHPTFYAYDADVLNNLECYTFELAP